MTIREIIKQKTREYSEDKLIRKYICREVFTQDATERKIRAAEYFAPILKEKFGEKYPLLDWEEESAKLSVLCYYGPDDINEDLHIVPAIAIFTADSIYHSQDGEEKIRDLISTMGKRYLLQYVDDDVENGYYDSCELDALHPFYPSSMLSNLENHIALRNIDSINYSKTKATSGTYSFICDPYTSSLKRGKKDEESETRRIFDSIMEMIPEKDKEEAIEEYKSLFFTLIDCYLETRNNIEKAQKKLEGRMENLKYSLTEELALDMDLQKKNKSLDYLDRIEEVGRELDKLDFLSNNLNDNYAMGLYATESLLDKYTRAFERVPPFDPYKVIAGYFFLLESGDSYAWLLGASIAPLGYAGYLLPWSDMATTEDVLEEIEENANKHYWDDTNDIYLPKIKKESLSIDDKYLPDKLSIAKAVYILTNTIPPRFNIEVPAKEDIRKEIGDEMFRKLENCLNFNYTTKNKIKDTSDGSSWLEDIKKHKALSSELDAVKNRLSTVESEKDMLEKKSAVSPDARLLEEIDFLKEKLNELNSALIKETAEKEKLRREMEKEKRAYRSRDEELYSLRELLFSRDDEKRGNDAIETDSGVKYPYRTDSSIIVVGGLPDWLKAMKNLLPDVKFFGDRAPQKEALKHCDIVWFQTYAGLSHKTFYKTIDDIKTMNIPIKYSPTSGVYKSAEAILRDDKERRKRR